MSITLKEKILTQTQHALQCGALQPIVTDYEILEEQDIPFIVRIVTNLARKQQALQSNSAKPANPFLPYEEDLFVTHLSDTHVCLLNKYNAVDHHILMVTREYEDQENWLNLPDFQALWTCLTEIDGLGFYNGGKQAGSSQPHKHLQFVPFPWVDQIGTTPLEGAILAAQLSLNQVAQIPAFSFHHALIPLDFAGAGATTALEGYYQLLHSLKLIDVKPRGIRQTAPYNLLVTRGWMMVVPRSQDSFQSIPVNSLGFAGALLVRNLEQLEQLKTITPLKLLESVSIGKS